MNVFFDRVYYTLFKYYEPHEKGASSSAAAVVGGMQAFNVLTIYMLFDRFAFKTGHLNKSVAVIIALIFQVTTYIRYIRKNENSVQKIEERTFALPVSTQNKLETWGIIYIFLSFLLFFGVAIFSNRK